MPSSLDALQIGARVVVRYRLEPSETAATPGHPTMTDALGELAELDAESLVVRTRRGPVSIRRDRVVSAKEVPPAPSRRGAAHLALSVADMARVTGPSWGTLEREPLGTWQLRASRGFTQRGSSVLVTGDPGVPLATAIARVEQWYAARGLPARVCLPGPLGFDPAHDALGADLLGRGWTTGGRSLTLTATTAGIAESDPGGPSVELSDHLTASWLEAYRRSRSVDDDAVEGVLGGSPRQLFASVPDDDGGHPIAIGRLGIALGWAGLGAVWTDPGERGRGLATHVTARLAAQAAADGIRLVHLQVECDNAPALRLYERLGFERHSEYVYLTEPPRA